MINQKEKIEKKSKKSWDEELFDKFDNFMHKITPFIFILAIVYFGAHLLLFLL